MIRQRAEPRGAVEERIGSNLGAGRELGPAHIANHQCMPGQDEPRFGASRPIAHEQRHVLRGVARRVEDADAHITDGELLSVFQPNVFGSVNGLVHETGRTGGLRESATARTMIRMQVGLNHVHDAHPGLATRFEVWRSVVYRIDDDALALAAAAEKIRRADWRGVEELAEDHSALTISPRVRECTPRVFDSCNEMIESL